MDLFAYANIDNLEELAKKNNIVVPRLRGYRLMKDEKPITREDMRKEYKNIEVDACDSLVCASPTWRCDPHGFMYNNWTFYLRRFYMDFENNHPVSVRWNRIHGWHRRNLKFEIKNRKRRYQKNCEVFNKYVGRDDVLYIHARIGGGNWEYYGEMVKDQPWFLEKVDDPWDRTYCDIYAKLEVL